MTFLTNAGADERIPPHLRRFLEGEMQNAGRNQQWEDEAKRAARQRKRLGGTPALTLEAQSSKIEFDGMQFEDAAPAWTLEEVEYDESVSVLPVVRMVECEWWPFKPSNARAGWRPVMGPKAWEAVYAGIYCLRCRGRHAAPHPAECARCKLTAEHRAKALDHLERVGEVMHRSGPNRAQRRAMQRGKRRKSGLVLV